MCGFVSVVLRPDEIVDRVELEKTTDVLSHRGPNDRGFYIDGNIGLGFRRLSILDLSDKGHQPMEDEAGRFSIVFNGEIYNYIELREELAALGYDFRSTGDTEVLLKAYIQWGVDCLHRLNGMWAFLIYDRKTKKIFGSRDRFGVKPLFYYRLDGQTIIASEIKAIRASNLYRSGINWRTAAQYLFSGILSEPSADMKTLYEGIKEVPAGYAFELSDSDHLRSWRYYSSEHVEYRADVCNPEAEFTELFEDSVKLRMRSDVPVGVCLSGGLDSTSIICHMARLLGESRDSPLHAFSFMSSEYDESAQIAATIKLTAAELHRVTDEPATLWDTLGEVLFYHDEPLHSLNVLVSYELYRLASENGVRVILNGQGADETLAGYPSYFYNYWYSLFWSGQIMSSLREMRDFVSGHNLNSQEVRRKAFKSILRGPMKRSAIYRRLSSWRERKELNKEDWFSKDLLTQYPQKTLAYESQKLNSELHRSVSQSPLPLYLRVEDRNSMAHSVETRLPFLDYRLVSLAFSLPDNLKLRGPWNKYILRNSMASRIPDCVRLRKDKMGFPVPGKEWLAGPLYEPVRDMMSSQSVRERGIYNIQRIIEDLDEHHRGNVDISAKILRVVQLERICQMLSDETHR